MLHFHRSIILWNTGRTGSITPVATFSCVQLAGTTVKRVTLHNLGFMKRNKISVGTKLVIIKSGNIIPKVIDVMDGQAANVDYPKICPSCGESTEVEQTPAKGSQEEMWDLRCKNTTCPAQNVDRLSHYLSTFGVLGLGESRVTALVEGKKVSNPSDFYKLTLADTSTCGLTERQGLLVLAAIHMVPDPDQIQDDNKLKVVIDRAIKIKKTIPLWRLFACLGIETAGKSAGKALVDNFGDFSKIRQATIQDIEKIENIGNKTAGIVVDFLRDNSKEIDELLKFVEPELPKTGILTGKTFCLSGGFPDGKQALEKKIEALGGKVSSSVSKNTSFLVQGTDAGEGKSEKADKYGVTKIDLATLKKDYLEE